ncbi:MAG: cupin domain-containing protein [Anaerolineae bacterium]
MAVEVVDLGAVARRLKGPQALAEVARAGDFAARIVLTQGAVPWHKHVDQDEMFLVLEGEISLESEWGKQVLGVGEMAVVSKGVAHRSASSGRSVVLLFERRIHADRQDGRRKLFVLEGEGELEKISLEVAVADLGDAPAGKRLVAVDDWVAQLKIHQGKGRWHRYGHDRLILVHSGELRLEDASEGQSLAAGQLAAVPARWRHRTVSEDDTVAIHFTHKQETGEDG